MGDLIIEINSNVDLVHEKRRSNAQDTRQFIRVLCEDVKQFLSCMDEELNQVSMAIGERDSKCSEDMKNVQKKLESQMTLREKI